MVKKKFYLMFPEAASVLNRVPSRPPSDSIPAILALMCGRGEDDVAMSGMTRPPEYSCAYI